MPHQRTWTIAIVGAAALISGTVVLRPSAPQAARPFKPAALTATAQGVQGATTIVPDRTLQGVEATPAPSPDPTAAPTAPPAAVPPAASAPAPVAAPAPPGGQMWFGVLQATAPRAAQERAAGVTVGSLELNWSSYEPAPGQFDQGYVAQQRQRLDGLRAAGLSVVLDVGMQYPPGWVFGLDGNTRFVNQYGDAWHGGLSEDVPNAVFDPAVRDAEAAYIARVAADLGAGSFWAIRAGGLLQNELRYPPATANGHANSYWAFDANAQAHSPVPGWRPGQAGSAQAGAFLTWYLNSLTDFQTWLVSTYRASFPTPWLQLLKPSWGLRPGDYAAAVARNLDGSTNPAGWGTLAMGLDWEGQVNAIHDPHVMLYGSWMERGDDGNTPTTMGPAHYLATLGAAKGIPTAGENADAGDSAATMATVVQRARAWNLAGLMWLDESSLFGGGASLGTYSSLIRSA